VDSALTALELVGGDLLAINVKRVNIARKKACDAMLLKVNWIGTVTEAIAA
jgi:enolase